MTINGCICQEGLQYIAQEFVIFKHYGFTCKKTISVPIDHNSFCYRKARSVLNF